MVWPGWTCYLYRVLRTAVSGDGRPRKGGVGSADLLSKSALNSALWSLSIGGLETPEAYITTGFSIHTIGITHRAFVMASMIPYLMRC